MDLKDVQEKTNSRTKSKNQFSDRHAPDTSARLVWRESHCPGIALREHEAKLCFLNLVTGANAHRVIQKVFNAKQITNDT